jgi:uncharacterized protein (DUF3084 family)
MIEERGRVIEQMSSEIAHRDEAIAAQAAMIEERWRIIQSMSEEIATRDKCIAGQAELVEQRAAAMQQMGQEIFARDQRIGDLEGRTSELGGKLAALEAKPLVRALLFAERTLRGRA